MFTRAWRGLRSSRRPLRVAAALSTWLMVGCASAWRSASPPEWSARETTDRPGVIEIEADRDQDGSFAKVLSPDGRTEAAQCESVPCRVVVSPGRYRVIVGTGEFAWLEAYSAAFDVEVAPCVTERLRVALSFKLLPGQGRVVRHERLWLASDPHRAASLPAGCPATQERPPTMGARPSQGAERSRRAPGTPVSRTRGKS